MAERSQIYIKLADGKIAHVHSQMLYGRSMITGIAELTRDLSSPEFKSKFLKDPYKEVFSRFERSSKNIEDAPDFVTKINPDHSDTDHGACFIDISGDAPKVGFMKAEHVGGFKASGKPKPTFSSASEWAGNDCRQDIVEFIDDIDFLDKTERISPEAFGKTYALSKEYQLKAGETSSLVSLGQKLKGPLSYLGDKLELFDKIATSEQRALKMAIASEEGCPASVLTKLAEDDDAKYEVASNSKTPSYVLAQLADNGLEEIVAKNPSADFGTIMRAAYSSNHWVNKSVAKNPSAPTEALLIVAKRTRGSLELASHPNACETTLSILSRSEDTDIKTAVARHENTNAETLSRLSMDPNAETRLSVAQHKNVNLETLNEMKSDRSSKVKSAVEVAITELTPDSVEEIDFGSEFEESAPVAVLQVDQNRQLKIRQAYEARKLTIAEIAKEHEISPTTVSNMANAGNWKKRRQS